MKNTEKADKTCREVCMNCRFRVWAVGIGQGMGCRHGKNQKQDGSLMMISSRHHLCRHYESRQEGR